MEKPRLMAVVLLLIIIIFAFFFLVTMELLTKFNFFIKMLVYLIFIFLAAFTIKVMYGKNKVISNNKINLAEFFLKIKAVLTLGSTVQKIVLVFLLFLAPTILIVVSAVGEIIFPRDTTGLAYLGFLYAPIGAILSWLCLISTKSYINRLNISKGKEQGSSGNTRSRLESSFSRAHNRMAAG